MCAGEMSPTRNASRVSDMDRNRRASHVARDLTRGSRAWTTIQSIADCDPSAAYARRASNAAVCSATTAANRAY